MNRRTLLFASGAAVTALAAAFSVRRMNTVGEAQAETFEVTKT